MWSALEAAASVDGSDGLSVSHKKGQKWTGAGGGRLPSAHQRTLKPLVIPKLLIESFLKYSIDLEMVNKRNPIWCERCDLSISILPVWSLSQTWELSWVICFFQDYLTDIWCLFYKNYFASSTVLFSNLVHRPIEAQCISFVSAPYLTPSPLSFLRSDRPPSLPRQQNLTSM